MKPFFVILLLYFFNSAQARNFYFSSISGDDSRTSAEAQNPSTPWKTLTKLNSYFSSLNPGDAVLLKRGETFYGSIIVNNSGTSALPITIGAYGVGDKPVITGLKTLSSWVSVGNGIYESSNSSLGTSLNMVLLNDVEQPMGRYPNADAASSGYLYFESHSGTTSITDNELPSSPNWTGAEVVVRQRRWKLDRATVVSQSGHTINNTGLSGEPYNDYGYFFQNSIKTLDKLGEWYYDHSAKKLSIYFGSKSPSSYSVQATAVSDLVYCNGFSNINFDDLSLKGANANGFNIISGSDIDINNCNIIFSGINGITANTANFTVENCTISYSNNDGIDMGHGTNSIAKNNKIANTSIFAGMGLSGETKGMGIYSTGDGDIIEYNEVHNTGYSAIIFFGNNVTIKNNFIDSFCSVKNDGGGIYTVGTGNTINSGRKIIGNIVLNGIGALDGTNLPLSIASEGIYMDNKTSGVEIRDNSVSGADKGVYLHNTTQVILSNNTLYDNSRQLVMKEDAYLMRNNTISNNIMFAKIVSQPAMSLTTAANDIKSFGRFDSNYYARPIDDRLVIVNNFAEVAGSNIPQSLDLSEWQDKFNKDGASKASPKSIAPYKLNKLIGSSKVDNSLTSLLSVISANLCSVSVSGGALQIVPSARNSSFSVNVGSLVAGKKYLLRYNVRGAVDTPYMSIGAYLMNGISPFDRLSATLSRKISKTAIDNEMLFSCYTSVPAGSLVFKADDENKFYLDNIELYEADAVETDPEDSIKFVYNATDAAKSISLNGSYIDVENTQYSNNIVLQPYASAVLISGKGGTAKKAPTVSITSPSNNATFSASADITINATAADGDGSVTKVDFYNGSTLLGSDTKSPYTFTWNNVASGTYKLTAKATDDDGLTTTSSTVTVSVNAWKTPTVSITSPDDNSIFTAPATIIITADASDDGSIDKVEFYNGNTLLGTDNYSGYSWDWDNVPAGNYTITAKAYDDDGNVTKSSPVSITVNKPNGMPAVSITGPADNSTFIAPATITITANANDDGSVGKVEFYNGSTLLGTDNYSGYSWDWDNVPAGNYTITAKAYDDDGNVTTSSPISISVNTPNSGPSVSITSPADNSTYTAPATIIITADASDDGSIDKVEFYNGNTLLGTDNYSGYSWDWDNVPPGNYTITAKAYDNDGNITISSPITVSVNAPRGAPSVTITSPEKNETFSALASITISADASDPDGTIDRVEFYSGNTLLRTENYAGYSWLWENVPAGVYTITARAYDNDGNVTISSPVTISVTAPAGAPSVSITSPIANQIFTAPALIIITADASDADGTIDKLEFYNGNTLLGTDHYSGYSWDWDNVPAGDYVITAKAYDNDGNVTISQSVPITVQDQVSSRSVVADSSMSLSITNNSIIPNNLKPLDFKLSPNPARSMLQINFESNQNFQKANLSIIDMAGRTLKRIPLVLSGNQVQVNISSFPPGTYIMRLSNGNIFINKKFVKAN